MSCCSNIPMKWTGLLTLLTALTGCQGAQERAPAEPPRHLVLVVFDTLRGDRLSLTGYERETTPHLDSRHDELLRFDQAIAPAPWTVPSHASIFTGLPPSKHWSRWGNTELDDRFRTLAEVLGDNGFAPRGISANTWVGNLGNLDQGFDEFDEVRGSWNTKTKRILDQLPETLDKALASDERMFLFLNFMHNHIPFQCERYSEEFGLEGRQPIRSFRDKWDVTGGRRYFSDRDRRRHQAAYDATVRLTDDVARDILALLEQRDVLDDTVVVFTSDHGEGLGYHQELGHTVSVWDEQLHVPLIVRLPRGRRGGQVIEERTSLTALAPTLLDWLGVERPEPFDEMSDLFEARSEPVIADSRSYFSDENRGLNRSNRHRYPELAESTPHRHVLYCDSYKYIAEADDTEMLFDLEADPLELNDLALDAPAALARCRQRYEALVERGLYTAFDQEPPSGRRSGDLPPSMLEALRNLGYVVDTVPTLDEHLADPPSGQALTELEITQRFRPHRYEARVDRALSSPQMTVGGLEYERGFAIHGSSWYAFNIEGTGAHRLVGRVGRDVRAAGGSIRGYIFVDGRLAFASGSLRRHRPARAFDVDVHGASTVTLVAWTDTDHNRGDHLDWAEVRLLAASEDIHRPGEPVALSSLLPTGATGDGLEAQRLSDVPEDELETRAGQPRQGLTLPRGSSLTYDLSSLSATRLRGFLQSDGFRGEPPALVELHLDGRRLFQAAVSASEERRTFDLPLPPGADMLTLRASRNGGEGRLVLEGLLVETSAEVLVEVETGRQQWPLPELPPTPAVPARAPGRLELSGRRRWRHTQALAHQRRRAPVHPVGAGPRAAVRLDHAARPRLGPAPDPHRRRPAPPRGRAHPRARLGRGRPRPQRRRDHRAAPPRRPARHHRARRPAARPLGRLKARPRSAVAQPSERSSSLRRFESHRSAVLS